MVIGTSDAAMDVFWVPLGVVVSFWIVKKYLGVVESLEKCLGCLGDTKALIM